MPVGEQEYGGRRPYGDMQRARTRATRGMGQPPQGEYESTPYYGDMVPSWRESPEQQLFRRLRELFGGLLEGGGRRGAQPRMNPAPWLSPPMMPGGR